MQQDYKNILEKNSERSFLKVSEKELLEIRSIIASLCLEMEALQDVEEKRRILSMRFGHSQNTLLHLAAKFGDCESLKKIISTANSESYVSIRNLDHYTPLHLAAISGYDDIAKTLLSFRADKDATTSDARRRWTPIHYAAKFGHADVVKTLIEAGVDKEVVTAFGLTPLIIAAEFGRLEVVQFLLSIKAKINAQTIVENHKMTALHYAVIGNFKQVATALLDAKIDKELEMTFGLTALEFSAKNNLVDMTGLLMTYGAEKWEEALEIAKEYGSENAANQIVRYQKSKAMIFDTKFLNDYSHQLIKAIRQFNKENLGDAKIILANGVAFNAYGILSLKHRSGFISKTTRSFLSFVDHHHLDELGKELHHLNSLIRS